jgi:hypothetical protein
MAADFKAFTSSTVLDNFQKKIDVLEIWDDSLLAGLVDGTLVVLRPDAGDPQGPWQVVQAYKNIAQKYIAQLQVNLAALYVMDQRICTKNGSMRS